MHNHNFTFYSFFALLLDGAATENSGTAAGAGVAIAFKIVEN